MIALLLAAALQFIAADADLAYKTAQTLVQEYTPRDAGTIRGRLAANKILDIASELGADVRRDIFSADTPNGTHEFVNLYAKFPCNDPKARWVILLSHFDTKPAVKCPGANDGASTAGLLVSLANVLENRKEAKGNVLLIWTDGEECVSNYTANDGFWGAKRAVQHVSECGLQVQAVLCLDMLGDKNLNIKIPANGDPVLAKIALHAARRIGEPDLVGMISEHVKDDHVPFLAKGYRAIDIIDFDYGSKPGLNDYWHTEFDTMDKISKESLLKSGRLVIEMLNILL